MKGINAAIAGLLLLASLGCKEAQKKHRARVSLGRQASAATPRRAAVPRRAKTPPKARPRRCSVKLRRQSWYQMASLTADRKSLARMYKRRGYKLPHSTRTMMLATRVVKGVGQPAFQVYSLGNTGFRYSRTRPRWWPASCVKPWAVAAALMKLKEYGIKGSDTIVFRDRFGTFKGNARKLFGNLTNKRYDRLMTIAGVDNVNGETWRTKYSLPNMVLLRSYGGMGSLRRSPKITYWRNGKRRTIPKRYGKFRSKRCRSNCTTLFELQDVIRRINMHDELPKSERFDIFSADAKHFKQAMLKIPNKMGRAFRKVFGRRSKGYNKSGSARGWDQIENVYIVPERGAHRYLIAASVPWPRREEMADPSLIILNKLGEHTMYILQKLTDDRVSIQADAGPIMKLQLYQAPSATTWKLRVKVTGVATIKAWNRHRTLKVKRLKPGVFSIQPRLYTSGKQLFVLKGFDKSGKAIAYHSSGVDWKPTKKPTCAP